MTPLRFGAVARRLFGLYDQPPRAPHAAALLLPPFGQEAVRSHRMYRVLARRLVDEGFAVLRFDYYGSGDSAGDDTEVDLEGCTDDALQAHAELLRHCGLDNASWFGLRLGAAIALRAATRQAPLRLVLNDPVVDGSAYLAELAAANETGLARAYGTRWLVDPALRARHEAGDHALGFAVSPRLRRELEGWRAADACPPSCPTWVVTADESPSLDLRGVRQERAGPRTDWATDEALGTSVAPAQTLRAIVACMTARRPHD